MKLNIKSLLSILVLMPMMAIAQTVDINGIYYNLDSENNSACVVASPVGYSGQIIIPESINYDGTSYNVTKIKSEAFLENDITTLDIAKNVETIELDAFKNCNALTSVIVRGCPTGGTIHQINGGPFSSCQNLKEVILEGCSTKEYPAYIGKDIPLIFRGQPSIEKVTIKEGVTRIPNNAFTYCYNLNTVTLPQSIGSIGSEAFADCWNLSSISLPSNIFTIGRFAFAHCYNLTSIVIPKDVTRIGNNAFWECTGLISISLPYSLEILGDEAFEGCSSLIHVSIPCDVTEMGGNNIKIMGKNVFAECTSLTNLSLSGNLSTIGEEMFRGCSALSQVTITDNVITIGKQAFLNCLNLASVTIGKGVTEIESGAFRNCIELTDVYCYAEEVPITAIDAFDGSYIESNNLYVPANSLDLYKAISPWRRFKTISTLEDKQPDIIHEQTCAAPEIIYQDGKLHFSCATEGAEFITDIADADIKRHYDTSISLEATYLIKVYAHKEGYNNSETVTATLCWLDAEPTLGINPDAAVAMHARPLLIQAREGVLSITGLKAGETAQVYSISGQQLASAKAGGNTLAIPLAIPSGQTLIVKIADKAVKVILK